MALESCGTRRRRWRPAARVGIVAALLVVLVLRIGGAAFARGLSSLTWLVVVAAIAATALSTGCAAWRWHVVARQLGVPVPAGRAVAAYYGSQFLNSVLPGGVAGDAQRAVAHGRDVGDVGRAVRAVIWDRTAGQIVQAAVTIAVLAIVPSPGRRLVPLLVVTAGCTLVAAWHIRRGRRHGSSWPAAMLDVVRSDLRNVVKQRAWLVLVIASLGVTFSHTALFVLVAHTVDPSVPVLVLVPLAVIVQMAAGIPLSVAGWGLRESVAAWAFAGAGLGAAGGVAASTAYGAASLIAVLPGAVLLGLEVVRGRQRDRRGRVTPGSAARREVALDG